MSEQAKIASLLEKIKEKRDSARNYGILAFIMMLLAIALFTNYFSYSGRLPILGFGIISLMGFVLFIFCVSLSSKLKGRYIDELESMAEEIPTNPNRNKELSIDNFEFCPFCGNVIKKTDSWQLLIT